MKTAKLTGPALAGALIVLWTATASAGTVYSQNFDTGSATFTTNDPYWTNSGEDNGYIVQTTNGIGGFGDAIPQDVSGTGYFLFDGTVDAPPSGNEFFISPTFNVSQNTDYTVSFYLTNANDINVAQVQADLDGTLLGTPVSAAGSYTDGNPADTWQQFSFTWNSGSNSTASLILHDYTTTGDGNDFGVDAISVSSPSGAPEPGTMGLLDIALAGLGWSRRRLLQNRN
jgi:hypothetical protein